MHFEKRWLIFEYGFHQLIDEIVGQVGLANDKIIHTKGLIILVEKAIGPGRDIRRAELRHGLANGFYLSRRQPNESKRLLRLRFQDSRNWSSGDGGKCIIMTGKKLANHIGK